MFKKNRWNVILSSVVILLPMLFGMILWNDLPAVMTTHFGADGTADGFGGKGFVVFGVPAIFLGVHFICLLFALLDKNQRKQNPKALGIFFWTVPILSLVVNAVMYRTALGKEVDLTIVVPVLLGVMFIFMGNYLPKVKQNRTLGIKVWWALHNEENWNRTHRFGGKVWVVGGITLLFSSFLPLTTMVWSILLVTAAAVMLPLMYSYSIYRQHQKQGIVYAAWPKNKKERIAAILSVGIALVIVVGVAILMFTGDLAVRCEDTSVKITATYWMDAEVEYSEIDTVAYRRDLDVGVRTGGFGSPRLSLGRFQNEEFGAYTLYAYTGAEEFVVLTSDGKTLVIGMRDPEDTQEIHDIITSKLVRNPDAWKIQTH